ncbi:hypothetical protein F0562_006588 [Nyssa sinensis]|uniref:Uncharacterized protein n=1 Tax=Nyssa sinensis TaxID=561372 RepID=A0A5J5AKX7_9ASTE|nr:hypothetical protein F0562_006588 [Nyssa sinensis]
MYQDDGLYQATQINKAYLIQRSLQQAMVHIHRWVFPMKGMEKQKHIYSDGHDSDNDNDGDDEEDFNSDDSNDEAMETIAKEFGVNRPTSGCMLEALHVDSASGVSLDEKKNTKLNRCKCKDGENLIIIILLPLFPWHLILSLSKVKSASSGVSLNKGRRRKHHNEQLKQTKYILISLHFSIKAANPILYVAIKYQRIKPYTAIEMAKKRE